MELNFNIEQAKTYFKASNGWVGKVVIAGLLCLLGGIPTIGLLFSIIYCGYMMHLTNRRIFKPCSDIPGWDDVLKYFITGLKATCFTVLVFGLFLIPIIPIYTKTLSTQMPTITDFIIIQALMICATLITHIGILAFVTNLKFNTFFKFKVYKFIVIDNFKKFAKYAWILCAISLIALLIMLVSAITIVLPLIVAIYLPFILADINAQYLRNILKITSN